MVVSTFLINTCVQAALLLIGTKLVQDGRLTSDILLAFMLYQGGLQVSIEVIMHVERVADPAHQLFAE